MTRRNLLKSFLNSVLSAPFLPLVGREKAEDHIAGADKMVEPILEYVGTKFVRDSAWSAHLPCSGLSYESVAEGIDILRHKPFGPNP